MSEQHLPGCRAPSIAELAAERGWDLPEDVTFTEVRIQKCEDACPVLAKDLAWAEKRAQEMGWA